MGKSLKTAAPALSDKLQLGSEAQFLRMFIVVVIFFYLSWLPVVVSVPLSSIACSLLPTYFPKSLILDTSPGDGGGLDSLSFAVDCFLASSFYSCSIVLSAFGTISHVMITWYVHVNHLVSGKQP